MHQNVSSQRKRNVSPCGGVKQSCRGGPSSAQQRRLPWYACLTQRYTSGVSQSKKKFLLGTQDLTDTTIGLPLHFKIIFSSVSVLPGIPKSAGEPPELRAPGARPRGRAGGAAGASRLRPDGGCGPGSLRSSFGFFCQGL